MFYFTSYNTMGDRIIYGIWIVSIALIIRAGRMGADKIMKCIIGNSLSWLACYFFWECIHLAVQNLSTEPTKEFLWITYENYANFLNSGQLTFVIILFVLLSLLIFTSSSIQVSVLHDPKVGKLLHILCIPLCMLSFIFSIYLALQGEGIQALPKIQAEFVQASPTATYIMQYFPLWNFLYYLCILLITHPLKLSLVFKKRTTILPEEINEM